MMSAEHLRALQKTFRFCKEKEKNVKKKIFREDKTTDTEYEIKRINRRKRRFFK